MKASTDRLIEIFHTAKAMTAGPEREQYLVQACSDDAVLKEQVLSLLRADEQAGDFLKHSQPPPLSAATEKTGDKIGHYKLLQKIGEGGCGIVYMAEQEEPIRRRVALKIIKLGMDTKQVVARFEAERQALAMMDHPHIAKVLDAGATHTGRPFFVMELVRGIKITDYCDQNHFSTAERLGLFVQVCQAIQHAHQKGVIHRDIKPSNILVAQHDSMAVPKVIDFGIAKATTGQQLTDKTVFTAFEQFMGTPAYMSPEQAQLSGLDVDTRTDIYALGVLLYELLTGRTPFDQRELLASGLDEMRRTIREKEPVKPSTRLSTLVAADLKATAGRQQTEPPKLIHLIRGDLDWIVMKCLEKDRVRRYETANGLARDVERHLNNELITARPPSNWYRLQKLVQRNRLTFAAGGTVAVVMLIALVVLLFSNVRIRRETAEKVAAWSAAQASERQAREQLFTSLRNQSKTRRISHQMGQRLESLAAIEEASKIANDSSLRDEAIAAMALPDIRLGPKWQAWKTNCAALACDPMNQRYAFLDYQGVVTVREIGDNREIRRFETGPASVDVYTALAFSPDGRFLARIGDWQPPLVWSLDSGQSILQNPPNGGSAPTFSADRRLLALAGMKDVFCFDLATGRESNHFETADRIQTLQFHPTDSRIAVGYKEGPWVSVYDASTGHETTRLDVGKSFHTVVTWHPEGRYLAVGGPAQGIQIWDVETRLQVAVLEGAAPQVDFLTYHPSGNWLASWSWDDVVSLWEPATGRRAMQFPLKSDLQFSRDGSWVGHFWPNEEQVQLLEFISPQEYFTLPDHAGSDRASPNTSAISPDDRLLVVGTSDGLRLCDLQSRRELARVPAGRIDALMFEAEGQALWSCGRSNDLQRWPFTRSATNASELQFGPPEKIALPFDPVRMAADHAVKAIAVVSESEGRAMLLDPVTRTAQALPGLHPMVRFVALSPDAKWVATSGWHSDRIKLWNAQTGEHMREWVAGLQTKVAFTPDSQELIVARSDEFRFMKFEGTLETTRRLKREIGLSSGEVAYSPDGKLVAVEISPAVVHLIEASSGRTVAQLEAPFRDRADALTFSRDGTKLVGVSTYAAAVHVWDLRAIRACLEPMGLDWDWPEFPPPSQGASPASKQPLQIKVLAGDQD